MNDPVERLRAIAAAHQPASVPDAGELSRRATARRARQGGVAGTGALCAVALLATLGGPSGTQSLRVTSTPSATPSPAVESTREPAPAPSPEPSGGAKPTGEPEPARTKGPRSGEPSPEPSAVERKPSRVVFTRPPVGPAPYYRETYEVGAAAGRCYGPATYGVVTQTVGRHCHSGFLDVGKTTYVVQFSLCVAEGGGSDQTFPSGLEADLHLTSADDGTSVYTWSAHQTYPPAPHTDRIELDDCAVYTWHLALADDEGRPLVSGKAYRLALDYKAAGESPPGTGVTWGFTAP